MNGSSGLAHNKRSRRVSLLGGWALAFLVSLGRLHGIPFATGLRDGTSPNDYVVGHQFQVSPGFSLRISALGGFDNNLDDFAGSAVIGLWQAASDGSWAMMRSVDVRGGVLMGSYRFRELAEAFEAGAGQYVITAYFQDRDLTGSGVDAYGEAPQDSPPSLTHNVAWSFLYDRVASGGGVWFPDSIVSASVPTFKAANIEFDLVRLTVPDSFSGLIGIGPILLCLWLGRRARL